MANKNFFSVLYFIRKNGRLSPASQYPRQGHLPQRFHSLKFEFHSDACHKLAEVLHEHVFQFTRERNRT